MPRCLFWKPRRVFKCNFCSLQLLMMLKEVTLWHLWEKSAIYLIHFALLLVNNHFSKIISTAKWPHNFSALCLGFLLHTAVQRRCGEANSCLTYQLKSMKCEHKEISPDLESPNLKFLFIQYCSIHPLQQKITNSMTNHDYRQAKCFNCLFSHALSRK